MKSCSAIVIKNAIFMLCPDLPKVLQVRRKFRTNGNKTRWWFVVHGPEEILALLDEQWPAVKIQIAWSLESCFAPKETVPDGSSVSPSEPSPLPVSKHPQAASVSNSPAVALDISAHEAEIVFSHRSPTLQPFLDHK